MLHACGYGGGGAHAWPAMPRTKTPKARGKTKIAKRDVKARRPRGPSLKFSTHALNAFARMIREAEQDEGEDEDGGGHLGGGGAAPST